MRIWEWAGLMQGRVDVDMNCTTKSVMGNNNSCNLNPNVFFSFLSKTLADTGEDVRMGGGNFQLN